MGNVCACLPIKAYIGVSPRLFAVVDLFLIRQPETANSKGVYDLGD